MPNHFSVTAFGYAKYDDDKDDYAFDVEAFNAKEGDRNFCQMVRPMPDEVKNTEVGTDGYDHDDPRGWYGWACQNWGTKWGTYNAKAFALGGDGFPVAINFQCAWGPPMTDVLAEIAEWMDAEMGISNVKFVGLDPYDNSSQFLGAEKLSSTT